MYPPHVRNQIRRRSGPSINCCANYQTNVRKAPNHKLPFISIPSGEKVPDSTLAYRYLIQHGLAPDIDVGLTDYEKAQSVALQAWLENWVYFLWCWEKYVDNWRTTRDTIFRYFIPFYPLRMIVYYRVYKNFVSMFYGMGITRHPREVILGFIAEAAKTMATLVGEKGFFDGKKCLFEWSFVWNFGGNKGGRSDDADLECRDQKVS
jgi:hypothetical protein